MNNTIPAIVNTTPIMSNHTGWNVCSENAVLKPLIGIISLNFIANTETITKEKCGSWLNSLINLFIINVCGIQRWRNSTTE